MVESTTGILSHIKGTIIIFTLSSKNEEKQMRWKSNIYLCKMLHNLFLLSGYLVISRHP